MFKKVFFIFRIATTATASAAVVLYERRVFGWHTFEQGEQVFYAATAAAEKFFDSSHRRRRL